MHTCTTCEPHFITNTTMERSILYSFGEVEDACFEMWKLRMRLFVGAHITSVLSEFPLKVVGITLDCSGCYYKELKYPHLPCFSTEEGIVVPLELANYFGNTGHAIHGFKQDCGKTERRCRE
jgi:hypothetical protein